MAEEHVHVNESSGNNSNFFLGMVMLIVVLVLFFYFGLPFLRNMGGQSAPEITVPDEIDVNVQPQGE